MTTENQGGERLKSCPFCGSNPVPSAIPTGIPSVMCPSTGSDCAIGRLITSVTAWNTRAPDPELTKAQARIKELESLLRDSLYFVERIGTTETDDGSFIRKADDFTLKLGVALNKEKP